MTIRISSLAVLLLVLIWTSQASAANGNQISEKTIERSDLSATIFSPHDGRSHPAILVLGGAEGGRQWATAVAKRLAQNGYIAMAETYFHAHGLPAQLDDIPLERFQAGIDVLEKQPAVERQYIAAVGLSKGAEAVLALASVDSRIKAVVAASPSDVIWQGIDRKGGTPTSSWSFHGKPLAYVPFKPCPDCKGLLDLYRNSRSEGKIDPEAMIPVEQISGPILLFSSKADNVWPSTAMSESIIDRLHRSHFRFTVNDIDYPEAGHFSFGIPPTDASAKEDTGFGGGNPKDLAKARKDSWQQMLKFLTKAFAAKKAQRAP